jgi:hypothetical protein
MMCARSVIRSSKALHKRGFIVPIVPTQVKNAPALKPGRLVLNTAYHQMLRRQAGSIAIEPSFRQTSR